MATGSQVGLRGETARKFDNLSAMFSNGRTIAEVLSDGDDGLPPGADQALLALVVATQNSILAGDLDSVVITARDFGAMIKRLAEMFGSGQEPEGERAERAPWSCLKRKAAAHPSRLATKLGVPTKKIENVLAQAEQAGLVHLNTGHLGETICTRLFAGRDEIGRAETARKATAERVKRATGPAPSTAPRTALDIAAMKLGVSTQGARKLLTESGLESESSPAPVQKAAQTVRKTHAPTDDDRTPVYRTQKALGKITRVVSSWDERRRKWIDPVTGKVLANQRPAPG